jgi:hypothetical protein
MNAQRTAQHLSTAQRQWRVAAAALPLVALAAAPRIIALGELPLCAFKHLSGLPCPLCGGLRACAALAQGDVAAALAVNAGLLPLLLVAALHAAQLAAEALAGRALAPAHSFKRAWQLAGGVLIATWLWRIG